MNLIERQTLELTYYGAEVQKISVYTTTMPSIKNIW